MSKPKIAIALGGGGVRGIAHIGVLEVLLEHGIQPDIIVGTSAGSIVGSLYASSGDIAHVKEVMLDIKRKDVMHFSWMQSMNVLTGQTSPMSLERLVLLLKTNLSTLEISEFKLKYAAVSTDIVDHTPYVFDDGNVIDGVLASTALPPVFSPHHYNGKILVDGGITHPVPVEIAKRYDPDIVIAVNINSLGYERKTYNILELSTQCLMTSYYYLSLEQSKQADFIIHPNLRKFNIFTDKHNKEIYEIGRNEALKVVPDILERIKKHKSRLFKWK